MYFDLEDTLKGKNFTTGDTVEIKLVPKGWSKPSHIKGYVMDV